MKIINLTQHQSTPEQQAVDLLLTGDCLASSFGLKPEQFGYYPTLSDCLTFQAIPSYEKMWSRAVLLTSVAVRQNATHAMIGGAGFFLPVLEKALKQRGIVPIHTFSVRESVEIQNPNGIVPKTMVFKHLGGRQGIIKMRTLDNIKSGPGRLNIPCIYNSGRPTEVRLNLNEPHKIHISIGDDRPYQPGLDSYLHIDSARLQASQGELEDCKKAIDKVNKHYFAGTLIVFSDDQALVSKVIDKNRTFLQWCRDIIAGFMGVEDQYFREFLTGRKTTLFDRFYYAWEAAKKQKERIVLLQPLADAHLGGSWQNYSEPGWLAEAEKMSQSKIYLA